VNLVSAELPILIVEDDLNTQEAMKTLLEKRGYPVVVAANGADGILQLRAGLRPCLIILDMIMPEKNGFQFRAEQILDPALSEIPVIICSGDAEAQGDMARLGAAAYFSKPVDVTQLLAVVQELCWASP
jgi:CheY-like chemotaxis protein